MTRAAKVAGRVLSFLIASAAVGAGIGFGLGEITARNRPRSATVYFAEGAAHFGAAAALIVGPVVYVLLRRRISFGEFSAIVTCTAVVGALAALLGWEFFVPIAAVLGAGLAAITVMALREV
jgi:hypothetical protein